MLSVLGVEAEKSAGHYRRNENTSYSLIGFFTLLKGKPLKYV